MTELWVRSDTRSGWTVLMPHGKIMFDTHLPFAQALKEALAGPRPQIVIDLDEVTLCDSSALQLLVGALRQARAGGGTLRLCRPQPVVRRVLDITNLTEILAVHPSVEAAVSAPEKPGSGRHSDVRHLDERPTDDM